MEQIPQNNKNFVNLFKCNLSSHQDENFKIVKIFTKENQIYLDIRQTKKGAFLKEGITLSLKEFKFFKSILMKDDKSCHTLETKWTKLVVNKSLKDIFICKTKLRSNTSKSIELTSEEYKKLCSIMPTIEASMIEYANTNNLQTDYEETDFYRIEII